MPYRFRSEEYETHLIHWQVCRALEGERKYLIKRSWFQFLIMCIVDSFIVRTILDPIGVAL